MREGWKEVKFGDISELIKRGVAPKYIENDGYIVINQKCIRNGVLSFGDSRLTSKAKKITKEKFIQIGDVLINSTGTGTLGRTAPVKKLYGKTTVDTHVTIFRGNDLVDKPFLGYLLKHHEPLITLLGKGATNQIELGASDLKVTKVKIPTSLETQRKIASILSAYDDLIENNLKRIQLLEEQAQLTYEEWFVRFKFPGHEEVEFVDGLPEGWERTKLTNLYSIKYGKNLPQTKIKKQGKFKVYGASGVMGFYETPNCLQKVVLITSRGNGSGEIHRTYEDESFVTNNSFIVMPKKDLNNLSVNYSQEFLKHLDLTRYCSGSAQPQLTNSAMMNIEVEVPSDELLSIYSIFSNDLIRVADNLKEQNQLLKEARDILLPRLMSGMIDPSASSGESVEKVLGVNYEKTEEGSGLGMAAEGIEK